MKMNRFLLSGTLILFLQMFFFSSCSSQNQVPETTTTTEKPALSNKDSASFLLDVRTPEEFNAGTVKGAVNIPLDQLENRLKELNRKQHIIVFCKSGGRSSSAIEILKSHGFTDLENGGPWTDVAEKFGTK